MTAKTKTRPSRATYGSKKGREARKKYSQTLVHDDVESRVAQRIAEYAHRRKQGDLNAVYEETEYLLGAAPYLLTHHSAETRDEERAVFKNYLASVEGEVDHADLKQPIQCKGCNQGEMIRVTGGDFVCLVCEDVEPGPSTYTKADFNNAPPAKPPRQQLYKPINHFNDMLMHFQGKELTDVPGDVIDYVSAAVPMHFPMEKVRHAHIKKLLRMKRLNKFYRNIPSIAHKALGIPPPTFTDEQLKTLRDLFAETQCAFNDTCVTRINFLSVNFLLYKFCELLGWRAYLPSVPLLKSPEKLMDHDKAWADICKKTGWQFFPTKPIPRCLAI